MPPVLLLMLLAISIAGAQAGLLWGGGGGSSLAAEAPSALALAWHVEPVHLDWEDVDCVLTTKDKRRKRLLKGVSAPCLCFNSTLS